MKLLNHLDGNDNRDTLRDRIVERELKKAGYKAKIRLSAVTASMTLIRAERGANRSKIALL